MFHLISWDNIKQLKRNARIAMEENNCPGLHWTVKGRSGHAPRDIKWYMLWRGAWEA
jgi:hypothetical protein